MALDTSPGKHPVLKDIDDRIAKLEVESTGPFGETETRIQELKWVRRKVADFTVYRVGLEHVPYDTD